MTNYCAMCWCILPAGKTGLCDECKARLLDVDLADLVPDDAGDELDVDVVEIERRIV